MSASKENTRNLITGVKRFYKSMHNHNLIDEKSLSNLLNEIKESKEYWYDAFDGLR